MLGFFHHWSMVWLFNSHTQLKENKSERKESERARKMFNRDCQLMALTWLLGRNKTAYIPTVSAVLRAVMYSAHPHESKCSPDQENMPLAVNSLQFDKSQAPPPSPPLTLFWITIGLAIVLLVPQNQIILISSSVWKGPPVACEGPLCPVGFPGLYV